MEIFKKITLHPFMLSTYPVLMLYAANQTQLEFTDVLRAFLFSSVTAGVLLFLLVRVRVEPRRAAAVVSLTAVLFFSFGHVYGSIQRTSLVGVILGQMDVLVAVWAAVWILVAWFLIRILKHNAGLTLFLNVFSTALFMIALALVLTQAFASGVARQKPVILPLDDLPASVSTSQAAQPDIYYIILDGYPRQDVLDELFAYDNAGLINGLQERGFYTAAQSTSNYSQTAVSLASSLNYAYLDFLSETIDRDSGNYQPLHTLIENNRARRFLQQRGYEFIAFETGYEITEIRDADRYIYFGLPINGYERLLLQNSLAVVWLDQIFAQSYRARITGAFEQLQQLPASTSPKLVFAHIMAAHPPYVFGPNGEVEDENSVSVQKDFAGVDMRDVRVAMMGRQITYINRLLIETVDAILRNSPTEPVIILQGDHGSGIYMDWRSAENTCFDERKAIFNAYYLPGETTGALYETITPVNTFRVVFNHYFSASLPLLEDRNFYNIWERPYDTIEVTGQHGRCPVTLSGE